MRAPSDHGALETLARASPGRAQRLLAVAVCATFLVASGVLLPVAARPMTPMPGFVPVYQSALIAIYGLSTYLFFTHYRHARSAPLLILVAGSFYVTLVVAAQLLSFPGILATGRVLGAGPDTTIWLWTFWHLGPLLFALPFAILEGDGRRHAVPGGHIGLRGWATGLAILVVVALVVLATTRFVGWLPKSVVGDDYRLLTATGIGPGVFALTGLSLVILCWTTSLRSALQLWLAVSLLLLLCDHAVTLTGGARGSVGWVAGRLEALIAGAVLLAAYLREADLLYLRAGRFADECARARRRWKRPGTTLPSLSMRRRWATGSWTWCGTAPAARFGTTRSSAMRICCRVGTRPASSSMC